MKRVLASIAILGMAVAGCASLTPGTPANSPAQSWLAVHGPRDWIPPEPMSLEVGEAAWSITPPEGGGVVTPDLGVLIEGGPVPQVQQFIRLELPDQREVWLRADSVAAVPVKECTEPTVDF